MKRRAEQEKSPDIKVRPSDEQVLKDLSDRYKDHPELKVRLQELINQGYSPIEAKSIISAEAVQKDILTMYPSAEEHLPFVEGYKALDQQMALIAALVMAD